MANGQGTKLPVIAIDSCQECAYISRKIRRKAEAEGVRWRSQEVNEKVAMNSEIRERQRKALEALSRDPGFETAMNICRVCSYTGPELIEYYGDDEDRKRAGELGTMIVLSPDDESDGPQEALNYDNISRTPGVPGDRVLLIDNSPQPSSAPVIIDDEKIIISLDDESDGPDTSTPLVIIT